MSITFQTDKVNSRALPEYGWRTTPYAYLLLKARGPQVDKLPPLRLDLDFLDTSGYVIIPVESPAVPLDSRVAKVEPRPFRKLQITQTLDERQADKGKLILEIKATALGLVPELERILKLAPAGFDRVKTDDQGVSVARFDPDAEKNVVVSERIWLVTFKAKEGESPAEMFRFGAAEVDGAEMTYQRYHDADLVAVKEEVSLAERYAEASRSTLWWWAAGAALIVFVGAALVVRRRFTSPARADNAWKLPERLTPFTVLGLLRRIQHANSLSTGHQEELRVAVDTLEKHYFAESADGNGDGNLKSLAERWLERAARRPHDGELRRG